MITLLFFAALREAAGTGRAEVEAATIGEALKLATERFGPPFERLLSICTILHGESKVERDKAWDVGLQPGDEVALLPPVSGGQDDVPDRDFRMIDVGDKEETVREATAVCRLVAQPATRDRILAGTLAKGDAIAQARVAGMLAAKRTPELIPMCHPVRTTFVGVECAPAGDDAIEVRATVRGRDRTGFEMEALIACSTAALALYDMAKAEDPRMRVEALRIVAKSGGKSGSVSFE